MSALLQELQKSRVAHQTEGEWFAMRWQPDIATDEILNVGVVFRERDSGRVTIKTLDYWDRLDCLFGDVAREQLEFLLEIESSQIRYGLQVPSSANMKFSQPRLARGESAGEIIDRLYDRVVTLGRKRKAQRDEPRFQGISTDQLQRYVYNELHVRTPFLHERLTSNTTVIPPEGKEHRMDVSFLAPGLIGNVVSTVYKDIRTASFYLLEATTRLEAAAKSRTEIPYDDDVKLFVLTPSKHSPGISKAEVDSIRRQIDEQMFRVQKTGIEIIAEDTKTALANEVIHWGEEHSAYG